MNRKKILLSMLCLLSNSIMAQQKDNFFDHQATVSKYNGPPDPNPLLPIKPARTISFTTTEASYMDVDLSPDGKTIVFDILGDIYTIPSLGGNAKQLTRGLAWNRCPFWSPDGKTIGFLSDVSGANHINIMNADGSEQRTLGGSDDQLITILLRDQCLPCWTPDGYYISMQGYLYHIAGGRIPLPPQITRVVKFSEDEEYIYYFNDSALFKYDRRAGVSQVLQKLPKNIYNVHLSPDLKWVAYVTGPDLQSDLILHNLVTGKDQVLVPAIERNYRSMQENYVFSSNSQYIIIGFGGKIHKIDVQTGADQIIPFSAKVNVDLGSFDYHTFKISDDSFRVRYTRSANESPDGRSLVFSALNRLYVMRLPNGTPRLLTQQEDGQYQPAYSPDGKWISYVTRNDSTGGALWLIPSEGGIPKRLTNDTMPGIYSQPTWSPDNARIAFIKSSSVIQDQNGYLGPASLGTLKIFSVKNDKIDAIADSIPVRNNLVFSTDGNRLSFSPNDVYSPRNIDTILTLAAINLNTKIVTRLVTIPRNDNGRIESDLADERQITYSPDGRYVVYEMNDNLYLSPLSGTPTPTYLNAKNGEVSVIRFADGGLDMHWENEGKYICWSYANQFYRVRPEKIVLGAVNEAQRSDPSTYTNGVFNLNVLPDETIDINLRVPTYIAKGVLALRNARIISMKSNEVIEHGTIIIVNNRITDVGPSASIKIPSVARIIDLTGKTIIPGLIDLHDHLNPSEDIFAQQHWTFLANLAYGVTTARDPSSFYSEFGYAELLSAGQMIGPRLFTVGDAVMHQLQSFEDARSSVRKRALLGATVVKQYLQSTRLQKQWLLLASQEYGLNMTNEGDMDARGCLAMIKDGSTGVEHTPIWGQAYSDVLQFVSQTGTWHTPTLEVTRGGLQGRAYFGMEYKQHPDDKLPHFYPQDKYGSLMNQKAPPTNSNTPDFVIASRLDGVIQKGGGHVGVGGHGNYPGIGTHWELWSLQMGGITNLEALRDATIGGAEALGVQADLGSLEVGKIADLIVLDKNPLEDIHNTLAIRYVIKAGKVFDGNTLDEVWPEKRKLPEWKMKSTSQKSK